MKTLEMMGLTNVDCLLLVNGKPYHAGLPQALSDSRLTLAATALRAGKPSCLPSIMLRHLFEARHGLRIQQPGFPEPTRVAVLFRAYERLVLLEHDARGRGESCEEATAAFVKLLDKICAGSRSPAPDWHIPGPGRSVADFRRDADVADAAARMEAQQMEDFWSQIKSQPI